MGDELAVRPMAGHIGAEIGGVDIAARLDHTQISGIRNALLEHKVLVFRDQHLDHEAHVRFGRYFGELTPAHPYEDETPDGFPEILTIDEQLYRERYGVREADRRRSETSYFAGWHSDLTPLVNPPTAGILRAETVPDYGGDTTWTNLAAAYRALSEPLRRLVDTLSAEHRYLAKYDDTTGDEDGYARRVRDNVLVAVHPVVRVHPESGERALFVNPTFTSRIVELSGTESRALLDLLFAEITRPAHTVRLRWRSGTVAFWDNRVTAHLAPSDVDHLDAPRVLYRVAVAGDVPVGVNGLTSRAISGVPFLGIPGS